MIQRNSTGEKRGGEQDRVELTILSLKGGILYDINKTRCIGDHATASSSKRVVATLFPVRSRGTPLSLSRMKDEG